MNEKLIEKKLFIFDQYEDEENYLRDKHKQGWKITKIERGLFDFKYYFEKCEPTDMVYQLDYFEDAKDDAKDIIEEKIQFYTDDGWELVARDVNHWYYFRKHASDSKPLLYSDPTSKINMAKKALNRVSIILTIALVILAFILNSNIDKLMIDGLHSLDDTINLIVIVLYELLLGMVLYFMGRALAFEKRYSKIIESDFKSSHQTKAKYPVFWAILSVFFMCFTIATYTYGAVGDFTRAAFVWIAMGIAIAFWMVVFGASKQAEKL